MAEERSILNATDATGKKKTIIIKRPYLQKVNRVKQNYKPEDVLAAMHDVWKGMSCRKAAKLYNIPRSTLLDKLEGKRPLDASPGPNPFLTKTEERVLETWTLELSDRGFPVKCEDLKDMAQNFILNSNRKTTFKNGRPGRSWMRNFLLRHPHLCNLGSESSRKIRSVTTRDEVKLWCQRLKEFLAAIGHVDISDDSEGSRIFNIDHGEFFFDVNTATFVEQEKNDDTPKEERNDVECVTVVATFSASGRAAPAMFVYPQRELPDEVVTTFPPDWVGTHSQSGFLTSSVFFDYIVALHRWFLKEHIKFPVVLLLDGKRCRLNLETTKFCEENGLLLYCLFPTPQPAISLLFSAMFGHLQPELYEQHSPRITKYNFALRLKKALSIVDLDVNKNVFEVYGVMPFMHNIVQLLNEACIGVPEKGADPKDCEPDCETNCELTPIEGEIEMEFPISQHWGADPLALDDMLQPMPDLNGGITMSSPAPNYYMVQVGSGGVLKLSSQQSLDPRVSPCTATDSAPSTADSLSNSTSISYSATMSNLAGKCNNTVNEANVGFEDTLPDLTSQLVVKPVASLVDSTESLCDQNNLDIKPSTELKLDSIENVDQQINSVLESIMSMESTQVAESSSASPGCSNSPAEPFLGFSANDKMRQLIDAKASLKVLNNFLERKNMLFKFTEAKQCVTFLSRREAEIAYAVLGVDPEPKRSQVKKELKLDNQMLSVTISSPEARQLRTGVKAFLDHLTLCIETLARFGPPTSDSYSHN